MAYYWNRQLIMLRYRTRNSPITPSNITRVYVCCTNTYWNFPYGTPHSCLLILLVDRNEKFTNKSPSDVPTKHSEFRASMLRSHIKHIFTIRHNTTIDLQYPLGSLFFSRSFISSLENVTVRRKVKNPVSKSHER